MCPNTPHVVFTAEHSVCLGGHFYATTTLRDTLYGMMHSFVLGALVTNADYTKEAFRLLARIITFYWVEFIGVQDADDGSEASEEAEESDDDVDMEPGMSGDALCQFCLNLTML